MLASEEGIDLSSSLILPRSRAVNYFPLSFSQQRIWFLEQLQSGSFAYNMHISVRLEGKLDVSAMREAVREIVRRHEILRTVFPIIDDQPVQVITAGEPPALPVVDLRQLTPDQRERQMRILALEEAQRPFDLMRGPLLRAVLLRLAEEEHV